VLGYGLDLYASGWGAMCRLLRTW